MAHRKALALMDGRANGLYSPYPNLKIPLEAAGFMPVEVLPHPSLQKGVSAHPDLQVCQIDDGTAVVAPNCGQEIFQALKGMGVCVIMGNTPISPVYPHDVPYNLARVGKFVFHNFKFTDPVLREHLRRRGLSFVHVQQGYTKCSTMVIDEEAIITEDAGIYKAAVESGLEAVLLKPGPVRLPGFAYGFIGGAAGRRGRNCYLFGNIMSHPQGNRIREFIQHRGAALHQLWDGTIYDVGSILFFG